MNLFKLFKRKKLETTKITKSEYTINSKKYLIENLEPAKVQCQSEDIVPYGWSVEYRCCYNGDGNWSSWHTLNKKIYHSKHAAIYAHMGKGRAGYSEYRIIPLYKFDNNHFRNHKIEQVLGNFSTTKKYELKAWKLKDDYNYSNWKFKKGTVFIQLENGSILIHKNCIDYRSYLDRGTFISHFIPKDVVTEIELKDEKWLYPHLLKCVKNKLKNK